jgi:cobalt-zinc-cadmium resistance protein CzcA
MFDRLIVGALRNRSLVLLILVFLVGSGVYSLLHLPIDAVPDITNVQVMALTDVPALGPEEVEQFITIPVENSMNGIPRITEVRSISQFGLSLVWIIFEDGVDVYWARQQVQERLMQVRSLIPPGFGLPEMGPIATGLGEIYQIEVRNAEDAEHPKSLMELRTILDWEVARPLKSVPGVVEVNAFGGELKTYEVRLNPSQMEARGIGINQVFQAVMANNSNSGGGYIQHNGEQRVIRAEGLADELSDIEEIILDTTIDGTPIYVRDIGDVVLAPMIRNGAVTRDGRGEAATATVLMLAGENSRVVSGRVKEKLDQIRERLPEGVVIDTWYDRTELVSRTISTVARNLAEGGFLVIVVLLVFLGNLKAGLIVAAAIPLSMLFAGNLMLYYGIAGSLMSLGAIDFGLVVDSAVIVVENCVGRLAHSDPKAKSIDIIRAATLEVRRPVVFGVAIIALVNIPLLALEGVEGKMFRPMALTLIYALTGSLLLSLTVTPVMATWFLKAGTSERETLPVRFAKWVYKPCLKTVIRHPVLTLSASLLMVAACVPFALQLGGEFIPQLDEGDLMIGLYRPTSGSLNEAIADSTRLETAIREAFPDEVKTVVSRTGRPEIGIDAQGVNVTDVFVMLNDHDKWTKVHDKQDLIEELEKIGRELLPGTFLNFTQPIQNRFNDLLAGVRADVGLGVYGDDLAVLQEKADTIAAIFNESPGAADVKAQVLGGLPLMRIIVDRDRIARYSINARDVLNVVTALGGKVVGQVVQGQRRFALQVRFAPEFRNDVKTIRRLKVADPKGRLIPLEDLADIRIENGVFEIWRKNRERRAMVQGNVRGRDLASFVAEAQEKIAERVPLPRGYRLEWGGTFENLQSATKRLTLVVPLALVLIFLLLYATFGSVRLGFLIFFSVPLGAVGGIMALWLRGINLSISAGVGFIALSGVAVLDGLVLVSAIRHLLEAGVETKEAIESASMNRLRPILMTACVASLGFFPMAFSHGSGAEVQRPLATVVIGGLITSTILKLLVIPAVYPWFDPGRSEPDPESMPLPDGHA